MGFVVPPQDGGAGLIPARPRQSGAFFGSDQCGFGGGQTALNTGFIYLLPFSRALLADAVCLSTSAGVGDLIGGLYSCGPTGRPDALLVTSASIPRAANMVLPFPADYNITEPVWLAVTFSANLTVQVATDNDPTSGINNGNVLEQAALGDTTAVGWSTVFAFAALPASLAAAVMTPRIAGAVPNLCLRAA